jgi:hypothetical protein
VIASSAFSAAFPPFHLPPPRCPPSLLPVHRKTEQDLEQEVLAIKDSALRHTLQFGIGLHHAGLPESDREVVERLYVGGKIQVGVVQCWYGSGTLAVRC